MEKNKLIPSVFLWMFVGLLVTFITGFYVSLNENMIYNVVENFTLIAIIELILVIGLSAFSRKVNYLTSILLYLAYSITTGLTFSTIFIVYSMSSIMSIFLIASLIFGIFALIGYTTKIDLSKFSTILFMILLGGVIVSIVNIFLNNGLIDIIISWVLLIVFFGITAYDMQKIKMIAYEIDDPKKVNIICALNLYLDFINIFLKLLRLFGKRRD